MIRGLDYYFCDYGDPKRDHFIRDITVAYDTGEETRHVINMYCPTNDCLNNALVYWAGACARGRNGMIEAAQICHVPRKMTDARTFFMMHDGTIVRANWKAYRSEIFYLSDKAGIDFWQDNDNECYGAVCNYEKANEVYGDFIFRVCGYISRINADKTRLSF